ncbi:MAG: amino acid permease [Myxococcota bacterium]
MSALGRLLRTKSLHTLSEEANAASGLKRTLTALDLVALGIGAIVGAGIFLTVGTAAAGEGAVRPGAGPAIILSFLLTGGVCALTALCYAELAAMIPISGSAYTYAFATLGELVAWIIGWDLLIEYAAGNVAVAISWSGYFQAFLDSAFGVHLPAWLVNGYRTATPEIASAAPHLCGMPVLVNLPAVLIVLALTWLLVIGVKESSRFNTLMVGVKLVILAFFVVLGIYFFDLGNWFPAGAPSNWEAFAPNGMRGIATGAAIVFFAYIGFDAVSTAGEEAKQPKRDLPIGILGSLAVCTIIYMVVAGVLTGMTSYTRLNNAEPLATALSEKGLGWASAIVAFGSVVAHTAVLLVFQLGQPRIFYSMARDGLLPPIFTKVHPKYGTPHLTTIATGLLVAGLSAFFAIDEIVDLTNIGTLFAFVLVSAGVMILRVRDPSRERPFRTPAVWVVGPLAILSCLYLMYYLPGVTWVRFFVWLLIGLVFYLALVVWNAELQAKGMPQKRARAITGTVAAVLSTAVAVGSVLLGLWKA